MSSRAELGNALARVRAAIGPTIDTLLVVSDNGANIDTEGVSFIVDVLLHLRSAEISLNDFLEVHNDAAP